MTAFVLRRFPQLLAAALCLGLASGNAGRAGSAAPLFLAVALVPVSTVADGPVRLGSLALALALGGWWWSGARLDALDRSPLAVRVGTAARARVIVTGPALRRRLDRSVARGLRGDRAAVVEGVVLGEDSGLSDDLRQRFRASGLYHLLAVSGQNVALV